MKGLIERLIGKPALSDLNAEIEVRGNRFVAVTSNGKTKTAHMEQDTGGYEVAVEKHDGLLGILMGTRVIFTSIME